MEQKIKSVEKGWGEGSTFFSVDSKVAEFCRVDEIKEEGKQVSSDLIINVFRGYKDGKIVFEMGASIDVTVLSNYIKLNKMQENSKNNETAQLGIGAVIGWVSVSDELPKEYKHRMSRDVLTIAGSKMSVKCYDYELGNWTGSQHITVTHWVELPSPPCR